ncbi:MAG: type 4a pilus biogenesis protein PilO [Candidatus Nealsonbacteria bacterium]
MQKIKFYLKLVNYVPLIIIITFILLLIIGGTFLFPKFSQLNEIKENIQAKEIELQYGQEYFDRLGELKIKLEENTFEISKISSALPIDASAPSMFRFIQETASLSGLVLSRINPFTIESLDDNTEINEMKFTVELSGTYSSFKEFLSILEKSARLFEVYELEFRQSQEEDILDFSLNLRTFSY